MVGTYQYLYSITRYRDTKQRLQQSRHFETKSKQIPLHEAKRITKKEDTVCSYTHKPISVLGHQPSANPKSGITMHISSQLNQRIMTTTISSTTGTNSSTSNRFCILTVVTFSFDCARTTIIRIYSIFADVNSTGTIIQILLLGHHISRKTGIFLSEYW